MALSQGTNSYVTVEEADAYFSDRLDVAAWSEADASSKEQSLITASKMLNDLQWIGAAISDSQSLAFPRSGSYFDPMLGMDVELTSSIPNRIIEAVYELAYHLLNNDGLLDNTGSLSSLTVGQISLEIKSTPSTYPARVKNLITPLTSKAGVNSWWRAN